MQPAQGAHVQAVAGRKDAYAAKERLEEAGIRVTEDGAVEYTEAAAAAYEGSPWNKDTPLREMRRPEDSAEPAGDQSSQAARILASKPRKLASAINRHIDALEAVR